MFASLNRIFINDPTKNKFINVEWASFIIVSVTMITNKLMELFFFVIVHVIDF